MTKQVLKLLRNALLNKLNDPLKFIFEVSLRKEIFPDGLKIARVTPFFKGGDRFK